MKFLVDVNLSPRLVQILNQYGVNAVHWSEIGSLKAPDEEIFLLARKRNFVVITHDLDFGAILAATQADAPSVIQIRTLNVSPEVIGPKLLKIIKEFGETLEQGALIVLDERKARIRILPLND